MDSQSFANRAALNLMMKGLLVLLASLLIMTFLVSDGSDAFSEGDEFENNGIKFEILSVDEENKTGTVMATGVAPGVSTEITLDTVTKYDNGVEYTFDVVSIDDAAFHMSVIEKVVIGNKVSEIGDDAFSASNLIEITFGEGITSMGKDVLGNTPGLTKITATGNSELQYLNDGGMTVLWRNTDDGWSLMRALGTIPSMEIPAFDISVAYEDGAFINNTSLNYAYIVSGVKKLGDDVFSGCENLQSVYNKSDLTKITDGMFEGCAKLTSVEFDKITSIGVNSFKGCTSLKSIDLSELESMSTSAFSGCTSLESADLSKLSNIPELAFYGCTSLSQVTMPAEADNIRDQAFYGCSALTSIVLPKGVTIWGNPFANCYALAEITPSDLGFKVVDGVLYEMSNRSPVRLIFCMSEVSGEVVIPKSVETVERYAFSSCNISSLNVTSAPEFKAYSISDCMGLNEITINNAETKFDSVAFTYASAKEISVTCPAGFTIPENAVNGDVTFRYAVISGFNDPADGESEVNVPMIIMCALIAVISLAVMFGIRK